MKYFDKLSAAVQAAFSVRAVDTDKLLYCVKADMDGEGCYYDTYITFDNKTLYLLSGYDRLVKNLSLIHISEPTRLVGSEMCIRDRAMTDL